MLKATSDNSQIIFKETFCVILTFSLPNRYRYFEDQKRFLLSMAQNRGLCYKYICMVFMESRVFQKLLSHTKISMFFSHLYWWCLLSSVEYLHNTPPIHATSVSWPQSVPVFLSVSYT